MSKLEEWQTPASCRFLPMQAELERAPAAARGRMLQTLHQQGTFTDKQRAASAHHRAVTISLLQGELARSTELEAQLLEARANVRAQRAAAPRARAQVIAPPTAGINPMMPPEHGVDSRQSAVRAPPEVTYYRGLVAEKRIVLERAFQILDPQGTGFLEPEQIGRALRLYGVHMPTASTLTSLLDGIERSPSGGVSWTQFLRKMCAALDPKDLVDSSVQVRAAQLRERLERYDPQRTGKLSSKTMAHVLRADSSEDTRAGGLTMYLDREEADRVVQTAINRERQARPAVGSRPATAGSSGGSARPKSGERTGEVEYGSFVDEIYHAPSLPWFLLPKTHRAVTDRLIRWESDAFGDNKSHRELHRTAAFVRRDGRLIASKGRVSEAHGHAESDIWSEVTSDAFGINPKAVPNPKPWSKHSDRIL